MRFCCAFLMVAAFASAQTRDLGLTGDRFKPLKYEEMTPEQKTMVDHLLSGERKGLGGPFNILLRSPLMGDAAQLFGAQGRFHGDYSRSVAEMTIIMTGRYWTSHYEWNAHKAAALQAGLNPAIVEAIKNGMRPTGMAPDLEAAYNLVDELLTTHQVSDARYQAAKAKFGEKGIVEMLATVGWYTFVSMNLNVDRHPLPNGVAVELKPLADPLPPANPAGFATSVENGKRFAEAGADLAVFDIAGRSPEMSVTLRAFGEQVKKTPVEAKLKELAMLIAARYWTSQVEWQEHREAAMAAGIKERTVNAIAEGKLPTKLPAEEQAVYNFCTQLFKNKQLSDATFNDLREKVGERGVVEITGAAGYIQVASMFLNVDRAQVARGTKAELPALAHPLP